MTFTQSGCRDSSEQLVHYRPGDYKLRDVSGGDGCVLCTELKLVELLKEELTRKAAELRVRINLSHSAINRELPPEVLAMIFEAYVHDPSHDDFFYETDMSEHPPKSHRSPLLFGAVCRTWRDIAWTTPRLWASVTIRVDFRSSGQLAQTRLVQEWLARSGNMPLSIRLVDNLQQRNDDISVVAPLITTINQYALRWRNLHIHLPTCMFPYFQPVGKRAPMLRYLKVEGKHHFSNDDSMDDTTFDVLRLGETPALKYVSTHRISLVHLDMDWGNITHFAGDNMTVVECLEVVSRTPLLEHCAFQSTSGSTHGYTLPSAPILAQCLRSFSVTFPNQNGQALIQSVTSPLLESFSVIAPPSGCLPAFFLRSHCPLQRLSITFFGDQAKYLVDLLRTQPSLTALSLGWSPLPDLLLTELAQAHDPTSMAPVFLPNLETLEFMGMSSELAWDQFAAIFPPTEADAMVAGARVHVHAGEGVASGARPWRSVKMTMVRDLGSAGRSGLPYIPEAVLPRLRHAQARGVEVEVKVTTSFDGFDAKDWMQMSEEHHELAREHLAMVVVE